MYKFDMNTDTHIIRKDYSWNHPSMAGLEPMNCDVACKEILDPNKTLEQKLEVQKEFKKQSFESQPPLAPEMADQVDIKEVMAPGLEGEPDVRLVVITPKKIANKKKNPAIVLFFGGGMIMGSPETQLFESADYAVSLNAVVVSVDYRLLPKHGYPAAVNDGEAAVNYILEHAGELHINPKKMITTGQSAGGYMSAVVSHRLKLRGGYQFAGQVLLYPVIDDTFGYPSSKLYYGEVWHPIDDQRVFEALMGPDYNRAAVPEDAIPVHCTDFKGLPPTVIFTGDLDYGHDPVIKYAQNIMNAGIYCDLHVWGGCFHGFVGMAYGTEIRDRAFRDVKEYLADLLTGQFVRE